jgi:hypothetical protein
MSDQHVRQAIEHIGVALQDIADGSGPGMTAQERTHLFERAQAHLDVATKALRTATT